ncbi:hypothetical protein RR48_01564 [Papilio machaon]|uniref:Nucleolar 27S pre-rRNA processing Urb2/Npa2 C-terminal domain-containing protein n=1 Tax=Papilio machaon TaxID=76193 RepID=A0A0N0PDX0_PAPMA|nr:hypothetical protein RR48_01564 [Papilio machaon]
MSSNPLNELKRRLDDDTTPLPKRLRLAKNVIHSDHFPAAPKERIVAEWLESITERNGLASKDIRHVISWLQFADELTNDLKYRLIKVVSHYLHSNPLNNEDIYFIINFLENDKISATLQNQIDDYLFIIITLLQNLRNEVGKNILIQKLFTNLSKYYKECKKKLKFIIKFLDGENLETIFGYLDSDYRNEVLNFEFRQKLKDTTDDVEKIKNKIITGDDILPQECIEMYGKWTSELMFRQNSGLLTSLQKDLEENCLMMLEEGFVSPSIIILTEVISAILSSFFKYSKMADHTVPQQIAEEFWSTFQTFGEECLKKFGECILKLNYNPPLLLSFLKLCLSYSQLKLLNLKYGNIKMEETTIDTSEVTDCSIMLPCLSGNQWMTLSQMIQEDDAVIIWDNLLFVKLMFSQLLKLKNSEMNQNETELLTKTYVIKQLSEYSEVITSDSYITRELFNNLDTTHAKQLAKSLVKLFINGNNCDIFKNVAISNNRILLNALVLETNKCIMKCFENSNTLTKAMNKSSFDIETFLQNVNVRDYFNEFTIIENEEEKIIKHLDILKDLQIYNLEENFRLTTIFVLLAIKKCCQMKKLRRNIDNILLSTYELSPKYPDIYRIFSVDFIFSFQDSTVLDLLKLSLKTSNNMIIIKFILELTVKKVKTNSEILKELVEILLSKQYSKNSTKTIEYFSDTVFQIQCIILPIIAKEKRAITSSAFRTILANLQEKLHQAMLESFMHIDFTKIDTLNETGNIDDSLVTSDRGVATLNAIGAYSLTLLKYCEMTDVDELKKLDCLWSGLEFFIQNAIKAVENPNSKYQHLEPSIQLLNIVLRYIKKLESHKIFQKKDDLFKQIWQSIKNRLLIILDNSSKKRINTGLLENIAVTLKFLAELSSVDCFVTQFLGDINNLVTLKKPTIILKDEAMTNLQLTSHQTSKYLLQHCLKANLIGNKCVGITKQMYQMCRNLKHWIQLHFESEIDIEKQDRRINNIEMNEDSEINLTAVKVDDAICNLLRIDLDMLSEVILAAKKTTLDYRFIDTVFELQHLVQYILGRNTLHLRSQITWQSFFTLHEGSITVLNNLLLSREELLEDRWPCYMQCYKVLIHCLCERASSLEETDRNVEQKLAETAHSIEKLTQSICKRKAHVSRIAAYAVADICIWIEKNGPPKLVRQHLENSIALLIQASDSTYAMAFLRRSLAGSVGQMTMSNMYSMYKRYHKYVGNA